MIDCCYILGIRRWCLSLKKSQKHLSLSIHPSIHPNNRRTNQPKTFEKNKMFFIGGKLCCKSDDGVGKNIFKNQLVHKVLYFILAYSQANLFSGGWLKHFLPLGSVNQHITLFTFAAQELIKYTQVYSK